MKATFRGITVVWCFYKDSSVIKQHKNKKRLQGVGDFKMTKVISLNFSEKSAQGYGGHN
jgi:hypothetical protein